MERIKRSIKNYFIFAFYLILLSVFAVAFMWVSYDDPDLRTKGILFSLFMALCIFFAFVRFCTGNLYYDEYHIEYHSFTGKEKFSIQYGELLQIEYYKRRKGKNSNTFYNFYTKEKCYCMNDINTPEALKEIFDFAQRYNPGLQFIETKKTIFSEKSTLLYGKSNSESEVLVPTIELSDEKIKAFEEKCSPFVKGMSRVCFYDASKSTYTKVVGGVSLPQSYLVIDIDTEENYKALNIDESDGNLHDVFPHTEELRNAFKELTGEKPGFVFFYWNED